MADGKFLSGAAECGKVYKALILKIQKNALRFCKISIGTFDF